jgi:hypothetical protein
MVLYMKAAINIEHMMSAGNREYPLQIEMLLSTSPVVLLKLVNHMFGNLVRVILPAGIVQKFRGMVLTMVQVQILTLMEVTGVSQ